MATLFPWRVGSHQSRNVYEGDDYRGVLFDPGDAVRVVAAMNSGDVGVVAGLSSALDVIEDLLDDDTCEYNGSGDCLAHDMDGPRPCPHEIARGLLARHGRSV